MVADLDIDLVCLFEVAPPFGPVRCRLYSRDQGAAAKALEAAVLQGGSDAEASFTMPTLSALEQLWMADEAETLRRMESRLTTVCHQLWWEHQC